MNGGHQTLSNAEAFLEQHVHDRGQAVGGAGGVGHDVMIRAVVEMVVHAHHHGEILVLGWGGNNHLLRAGFDMALGLLAVGEEAGGFNHHVHAEFLPWQFGWGWGFHHLDLRTVHHEGFVVLMADFAIERALSGIVFEQVGEVIGGDEIAHSHYLHAVADEALLHHRTERQPADPSETIDCYFD